jgi:hypothetical protein
MVMCRAVLMYPALMCEVLVCVDDSLVSHFRMQNSFPPFLTLVPLNRKITRIIVRTLYSTLYR